MRVIITGAAGFLGKKLADKLIETGTLAGANGAQQAVTELVLFDVVEGPKPDGGNIAVEVLTGDMSDAATLDKLFAKQADSVFHLAAVVSAQAEEDFDLGMRVNFDGTRALLMACRAQGNCPRFVMPASVAVMGGDMPDVIEDNTGTTPTNSYGATKAMCEILVNDCSRKGFVDGRTVRLPTITVRPGKPNRAASGFASSIIREPMQGDEMTVPVPKDTELWIMSPRKAIETMIFTHDLPAEKLGTSRMITPVGITVTVADMVESLRKAGGEEAVSRISWQEDPAIMAIVCGWPGRWASTRAKAMGFPADDSMDAIVEAFVEDDMVKA
ncbi:MAG: SDR family oxidoreductase [Rhodospirillales bacterium]|nr:SDR family oxidoreductase [Rhodospirillales bacterium]